MMDLPFWGTWKSPPEVGPTASTETLPAPKPKAKHEPAAWRPMTDLERRAAKALGMCRLQPASADYRQADRLPVAVLLDVPPADRRSGSDSGSSQATQRGGVNVSAADKQREYIGDAVYAEYDGFGVMIYTDRSGGPYGGMRRDWIYLEPAVLAALNEFVKRMERKVDTR